MKRIAHTEDPMRDRLAQMTRLCGTVPPSFSALPNEPGDTALHAHEAHLRELDAVTDLGDC